MQMLELLGWVFVNICVPALAPIVLPCVLLLTSASPLVGQLILRSVSDGQLYWIALAFTAATYSELSELRALNIALAAAGQVEAAHTEQASALFQGALIVAMVTIAVLVMQEARFKVQARSPHRTSGRTEVHANRRMIVTSIVFTILTGAGFATAHRVTLTTRSDAVASTRAQLWELVACLRHKGTDCELKEGSPP